MYSNQATLADRSLSCKNLLTFVGYCRTMSKGLARTLSKRCVLKANKAFNETVPNLCELILDLKDASIVAFNNTTLTGFPS